MTITYPTPVESLVADRVYQPQSDSHLLVSAMRQAGLMPGRRVLDLCTGSGFVAIAAAQMHCASVTAFDICPHAVSNSRGNAVDAGVNIDVRHGTWVKALDCPPFDVVVCNPPYVPTPPVGDIDAAAPVAGPAWAWDAGVDGRRILDPLCSIAPMLLCNGGSLLLVHSALAGAQQSLDTLRTAGMGADIVARQTIPFGPVLTARARWLERTGQIAHGCREEELIVIRADKP